MDRRTYLKYLASLSCFSFINQVMPRNLFFPELTKEQFGKGFKWGAASASYQSEGAWNIDGKSESIWDRFSHTKGRIKTGENGDIASSFYTKYEEDISILKSLNLDIFRFSLSWSRILPEGSGKVNPKGIDFYNRVIDKCLENDIEPWVTLYHWDLPQIIEDKGGWASRDIVELFKEYAGICAKNFGDRVKNWIVLNEPMAFTGLGYMLGIHAPGYKSLSRFFAAVHHAALCQAEGGRVLRELLPEAHLGTTFSCSQVEPFRDLKRDINAAERMDALLNRLFVEPLLGMGYPMKSFPLLHRIEKFILDGDEKKLAFDYDFIGVQYYYRTVGKFALFPPAMWAKAIPAEDRKVPINTMKLENYPEGMYAMLKKYGSYPGVKKLYVTESGVCCPDVLQDGIINDTDRIKYYKDYLKQVLKAIQGGIPVKGFIAWSLTDNFEWAEGFFPRFGLIYVDYQTQQRFIKNSGLWFKEFLK